MPAKGTSKWCAVYTRKSSEEGLERRERRQIGAAVFAGARARRPIQGHQVIEEAAENLTPDEMDENAAL